MMTVARGSSSTTAYHHTSTSPPAPFQYKPPSHHKPGATGAVSAHCEAHGHADHEGSMHATGPASLLLPYCAISLKAEKGDHKPLEIVHSVGEPKEIQHFQAHGWCRNSSINYKVPEVNF